MPLGRNSSKPGATRIQRADVVDPTPVEGNLVEVKKAKFITLVGKPANQTGFKVVRSDKGEPPMSQAVVRRTRRSETGPVLRLTFPAGADEKSVNESLQQYGLTGYTVQSEGGVFTATRADLKSISPDTTMQIKLSEDGLIATVARQSPALEAKPVKGAVAIARMEFDGSKFTLEEVKQWVADNAVDGTIQEPQNEGDCYVVRRSEVPENEETREMSLEDGVVAVVVRADVMSVPAGFVAVVNETAYGNWGWGQLDFAAALADQEFSEAMRDALNTLNDVLRNIVIWSPLPLDVRKELANRALTQFGEYISTVMDSLPRQLLVAVVRSANQPQEKSMTQAQQSGSATTTATPATQTPTPAAPETPITRSEVQSMIQAAVQAATEAAVKRSEPTPAAPATTTEEPAKPVTREDLTAAIKAVTDPLVEAMKGLQGTTVLRSAPEAVPSAEDPNKKDVFRGAMPGLRRAK